MTSQNDGADGDTGDVDCDRWIGWLMYMYMYVYVYVYVW